MSDFVSNGWSIYIATVVVLGLVMCLWVLMVASRRRVMADDNSTGHVWDVDLKEMNNPLPRWWMGLFVLTVIFAAAYLALYPGLGSYGGQFGWSAVGQHETEVSKSVTQMAPVYAKFRDMPIEAVAADAQARGIGERLFVNNCAACHGSDARGNKGYPNLTDKDWLHGGSGEKIVETISLGRQGVMPPMAAAVGSADDVRNVANYVLSLSGSPHNSIAAQLGKSKFAACAACHGADGKGNQTMGAPNLTDKVWLHGWGEAAIVNMVNNGKTNVMPSFSSRLTADQIKVVASYVWGLSNLDAAKSNSTK